MLINSIGCEDVVDVAHSRNYSGQVWDTISQEIQSHILEDLMGSFWVQLNQSGQDYSSPWEHPSAGMQYLTLHVHLILPKLHILVTSDGVKHLPKIDSEFHHTICGIPLSSDILWHHASLHTEFTKDGVAARKDDCCWVFDGIRYLAELCGPLFSINKAKAMLMQGSPLPTHIKQVVCYHPTLCTLFLTCLAHPPNCPCHHQSYQLHCHSFLQPSWQALPSQGPLLIPSTPGAHHWRPRFLWL